MTRHGPSYIMAAYRTRWSADKCDPGTGMGGSRPKIIGKIATSAHQIGMAIDAIRPYRHHNGTAINRRHNPPKHKSP